MLLSLYALDYPHKVLIRIFGCTEYAIRMAKLHAWEHGPGYLVELEADTRPGRAHNAGFKDIVKFVGRRDNLHRLPSSLGKGIQEENTLLKRKSLRSVLFRKLVNELKAKDPPQKCPARSFFYSVFKRIVGVQFSDREATECGCPQCISMVTFGWEELAEIVAEMLPLLGLNAVTRHELSITLEQLIETCRRWLYYGYSQHLTEACDNVESHCFRYALSAEVGHTCHVGCDGHTGLTACAECSSQASMRCSAPREVTGRLPHRRHPPSPQQSVSRVPPPREPTQVPPGSVGPQTTSGKCSSSTPCARGLE
jgi:hypothetical protein